jgi:hypothetical protein
LRSRAVCEEVCVNSVTSGTRPLNSTAPSAGSIGASLSIASAAADASPGKARPGFLPLQFIVFVDSFWGVRSVPAVYAQPRRICTYTGLISRPIATTIAAISLLPRTTCDGTLANGTAQGMTISCQLHCWVIPFKNVGDYAVKLKKWWQCEWGWLQLRKRVPIKSGGAGGFCGAWTGETTRPLKSNRTVGRRSQPMNCSTPASPVNGSVSSFIYLNRSSS